ncbi:hypothetical protein VNO78_28826 [Psophocarpus tetragonolobus]|uniref:FMR1-interacting protein 1 conserved domain-containing protein n=1 Tax=Psophocarpus tetragonolobus TaxID=3891 RepID=A0AAN9RTU8_PSOTE
MLYVHIMSNNTNSSSSKTQPIFMNTPNPNPQHFLQNNGGGMPPQPQLGAGNHQGQNFMPPFMQPPMNAAPFMNAANHNYFPLQNNQLHLSHMGLPGHQQGQSQLGGLGPQSSVGIANYNNPMFPVQGQVMQNAAQLNLSQLQGQILAQSILNMLQQPNMTMSMPNGQFCAPYPMQNMNQQLAMQMPNSSQGVPYGMHPGSCPTFGFPNQVVQAMVPQNSMFSANPQLGLVPGNHQAGPQIDPNQKNLAPLNVNTNAFVSSPFSSQQLQGNASGSPNPNLAHTNNPQPPAFTKSHSQENPNSNIISNVPNTNWKGSPSKNFKIKPNRGGFQRGFQKSKYHDVNNGKKRSRFSKEHNGKGLNSGSAGLDFLISKELKQQPERSFSVTYTVQEIQHWREARKKNHPFSNQKNHSEHPKNSKVVNRDVLQRELKEVLAKQAKLGLEVAEIPSHYLRNSENEGLQNEGKNKFTDKRKVQNKFNKKSDRKGRFSKKQKFADKDFSERPSLKKRKPTLLQKLLSADIKRDKSHLLQVFRFMVMNSFFKHCPDKPLIYPFTMVKENRSEVDGDEKYLHIGKDVLKRGNDTAVQKIVSLNNDNGHNSEDEDSSNDENDSIVDNNPHKDPSSLVKRHCDAREGIEKSDEEEGEIIE